jgi:hypothetical protein
MLPGRVKSRQVAATTPPVPRQSPRQDP